MVSGALLLAACGAERPPLSPSGFVGAEVIGPRPIPDLELRTTDGAPYRLAEATRGRVTLLFFGYTSCPDICPVHLANLAAVLDKLPGEVRREITVVFVTTDPARDTPERLGAWVRGFDPDFVALTGSDSALVAAQLAAGVAPAVRDSAVAGSGYLVGHAAQVIAYTRDGFGRVQYPSGTRQRDWAHDLPRLVAYGATAR